MAPASSRESPAEDPRPQLHRRRGGRDQLRRSAHGSVDRAAVSAGAELELEPGEDPLLNGTLVAAEVKAAQAQHVVATLKHFAANNQETDRRVVSVEVGERALRELHLLPYEIALARSGAASVMCAYNRVRGTHACENVRLLRGILKGEWAFPGQVRSD